MLANNADAVLRGAQLRLRTRCAEHQRRGHGRADLSHVLGHHQRCRTRPRRDPEALHRTVRPLRPHRNGAFAVLRPCRSDAVCRDLEPGRAHPATVRFDYEKLSAGHAKRCDSDRNSSELVSYGAAAVPTPCASSTPRPGRRTRREGRRDLGPRRQRRQAATGASPRRPRHTFGGRLVNPSAGTPAGPWLRTGDLGVISDDELFIVGRIKDLLIVDGRNHYPDDIEGTIQEITGGRVAAISVPEETRSSWSRSSSSSDAARPMTSSPNGSVASNSN